MDFKKVTILAVLGVGLASRAVYAQPPDYPPPQPPQDYGQPSDMGQEQALPPADANTAYNQPYDQPGQPQPYDPMYDNRQYDQGQYDQGYQDDTSRYQYGPNGEVGVDFFYRALAPYGEWVDYPRYGWVWLPHVRIGWRPYAVGRWVLTDYGWTWVSEEPWGWAAYHYGRWFYDPEYGWLWRPGHEWGPAWVSWQTGAGYIGWAPLPPSVEFNAGIGLRIGRVNLSLELSPTYYTFVPERAFLSERVYDYAVPRARNVTIINNTTNVTNYTVVNNRIVNESVPVQRVEQATGQRVQRFQVTELRAAPTGGQRGAAVQGNRVAIFRPPVNPQRQAAPPPPAATIGGAAAGGGRTAAGARGGRTAVPPSSPSSQPGQPAQPAHPAETARPGGGSGAPAEGGSAYSAPPSRQPAGGAPRTQAEAGRPRPSAPAMSADEIARRQQAEKRDLQQQQTAERARLQQLHQQEQANQQARATAQDLAQRHQAEAQALQQQHQREQQQLEARHRREQQQPPPQAGQRGGQGNQGSQEKQQGNRNQPRERKPPDSPPPPPPR